jgi:hypothetical protein
MSTINFIIVGIIVLVIALLIQSRDYGIHPRIIWTYWDNPNKIPKTVMMCMESWKKSNPNYEIILLTKYNYKQYVNIPEKIVSNKNFDDNPTRFADLVRVYALAEHGGVWVDSSILISKSLDDWLFPRAAEFSGFYIDGFTKNKSMPVIENWFFACDKNSRFMKLWRDEFSEIANYSSVEEYVESRKQMGVDFEKITLPNYLAMHISAQKVLQIDKYPIGTLILNRAEDGPLKYLSDTNWNSSEAMKLVCKKIGYRLPLMKMRSSERNILENEIEGNLSNAKCGWLD